MNARIASAQASIASSLSDEATQRTVFSIVAATVLSYAAFSVCYAVLAYALWAWLAFVIAAIASMATGRVTVNYAKGAGYDHAVNAVASIRCFFAKKVAS